jgi:hypothetical protein
MANLDGLAFEGATKRNRPSLKVCNLVFGTAASHPIRRSALCSTPVSLLPTKTWNPNWSASMHKRANQRALESSKAGSC